MPAPRVTEEFVKKGDQSLRELITSTNKETVDTIKSMKEVVDRMYYQTVDNFAEMKILKMELKHIQETQEKDVLEHCEILNQLSELEKTVTDYKAKMRPWELKMELKRAPYIFFMLTWVFLAWKYIQTAWIAWTTKAMTGG